MGGCSPVPADVLDFVDDSIAVRPFHKRMVTGAGGVAFLDGNNGWK